MKFEVLFILFGEKKNIYKPKIYYICIDRTSGVTQAVLDYLLWHHLGPDYTERAHDLINVYTHYFNGHVQPGNMAKLVEQFIWRSDIPLDRTGATLEVIFFFWYNFNGGKFAF